MRRIALSALALVLGLLVAVGVTPSARSAPANEPTTPILDSFDGRGLEDPLDQWGNWATTSVDGSGPTMENLGGNAGQNEVDNVVVDSFRSVESPPGDAEVYGTIANSPWDQRTMYLYLNLHDVGTPGVDGYEIRWFHWVATDGLYLRKIVNGVSTSLVPPLQQTPEPGAGDTLLLRRVGNTLQLWHKKAGMWSLRMSHTDANPLPQGGRIGLGTNDTRSRWDNFGGSGSTTPPPPPPMLPGTAVLDDFERPDEDPLSQGGAWTSTAIAGSGQTLEVLGGRAGQNEGNGVVASSYRPTSVVGDSEVFATMPDTPENNAPVYLYLHLREAGGPGWDGYRARFERWVSSTPDTVAIQRAVDGQATTLVSTGLGNPDLQSGDVFVLRRVGSGLELWRRNAGTWTRLLSTSDGSYTQGMLGLGSDDDSGRWDDFGGGEIAVSPPPPPPPPPPPTDDPPPEQSRGICTGRGLHAIATSRCLSDPVNTLTGAFVTSVEELSVPGTGVAFAWSRSYTSSDPTVGRLGAGWTDGYATSLSIQPNGDVVLHGDEGQLVSYVKQPSGSFAGAPGALSTLSSISGGYELVRADQVVYRFDAHGRLLSTKDRNGQGLTFAYGGAARLTTITDAAGRQVTISYDAAGLVSQVATVDGRSIAYGYTGGRLTSVTDVRGKTWRYTYDAAGRLATIVDPLDRTQVTNAYGADGRVVSQSDALGGTTTFSWNETTQTATVTDANGNAWKDDYEDNVLVERTDPLGNVTAFDHDSDLNTSAVVAPTGEQTALTHDARGNLLTAMAPASLGSAQKTFVYNARNDPTQVTDASGAMTTYAYDASGNVHTVVQAGTQVAAYTYDAAGRVVTATDGNSKTTTYAYDASGNVASETDPLGHTTTYTYDAAGRVLTRVDPKGNVQGANPADFTWRWTYDDAGRVLTERDPLGNTTTHTYDAAGNELTVTDANGRTTAFAYDAANRVVSETRPDPDGAGPQAAPVTTYTYDDAGNRLTETDALGNTTTFAYDAANRLVSTTGPDPDGAGPLAAPVTTTTYDPNGNVASVVEPRGNVQGASADEYRTLHTYDAAGRLLTTTDPLGNVTTNAYDVVGNLVSVRDANGHVTAYTYDGAGRLLTVTGPDGGVTTHTYDAAGNRLTRRDANGHVTSFAYDGAGRLVSETSPDPDGPGPEGPAVRTHAYDPNGNRLATTDPNGNATPAAGDGQTTHGHDRANRLTSIDYSETTPDVTFSYDAVGSRLTMTDGSGTETRTYDGLDRLVSVSRGSNTFSYNYDSVGNLTRRAHPGNTSADYVYDALDRLVSVASGGQTTTYAYDVASNPIETRLPSGNGHVETRVYDRAGRLAEVANQRGTTVLARFVATRDAVGNPLQVTRTGALTQTQTYTYDASDRIISVCFQAGTCPGSSDPFIRWSYDAVGNRLSEQRSSGTTSYSYDARDRLLSAGSTTFAYDHNGNQTQKGSRTFTYDLADRLRTTRQGSTTTTYSHDGDGKRLQTSTGSSNSAKTNFHWDVSFGLPQLARETNGSGSLLRRYVYGDRRIAMTTGSNTSYYHYDTLGSAINMTSSSGSRRWTWSYEPFGSIRTEQRSGDSAPANFMKFAGEYLDPTGLYHLRARQYDAATGRFVSRDPIDAAIGAPYVSAYAYAASRPTVFVDPSGETFHPSGDGHAAAIFAVSMVGWVSPNACQGPFCTRPSPSLVHPIPIGHGYSSTSIHPTSGLPGYPAIDFLARGGTAVLAVQSGEIRRHSGRDPASGVVSGSVFGWSLYLRADSGSDFFYTHLGRRTAREKERVVAGQIIGEIGHWPRDPGRSHVHIGVSGGPVSIEMVRRAPRVMPRR